MTKINSRAKGQTGEREVADMLNAIVFKVTGVYGDFKRNLQQTQDGGFDLFSEKYPYFAIEVKRVEQLTPAVLDKFWEQARRQATRPGWGRALLPILIYRKNRSPWRVRTYGSMSWSKTVSVVDVDETTFTWWFEEQIGKLAAL